MSELFIEELLDELVYQPAFHKLQAAQKKGHYTAIYSSSPDFLVQRIAKKFSVDHWLASAYATNHTRFTHIEKILTGEIKAQKLKELAHLLNIPLSNTVAYSDSCEDLPLLKAAGQAVGVNPDKKLAEICKKNNWEMI